MATALCALFVLLVRMRRGEDLSCTSAAMVGLSGTGESRLSESDTEGESPCSDSSGTGISKRVTSFENGGLLKLSDNPAP